MRTRIYITREGYKFYCRKCSEWHHVDYGSGAIDFDCGLTVACMSSTSPDSCYYSDEGFNGNYLEEFIEGHPAAIINAFV